MGCCWWWHHGGKWCQRSISAHFNALTRRTDGWYLLGGECTKCFVYQVWMCRHHVLPADGFHHVCGMTPVNVSKIKSIIVLLNLRHWLESLRVDEINRLRFKLISTVEIGEYQRLSCCFYWQVYTQRFFAHHFKLLQGILKIIKEKVAELATKFKINKINHQFLPYRQPQANHQPSFPSSVLFLCKWTWASLSGLHGQHQWWRHDSVFFLPFRAQTLLRRQDFVLS